MLISAYVPRLLGELLLEVRSDETYSSIDLSGVVLFADIADSTKITEEFAAAGAEGAERLGGLLNRHFGGVFDIVEAHGGDVIKLHGDAVLALWRSRDRLDNVVTSAARAALALRESSRDSRLEPPSPQIRHRTVLTGGRLKAVALHSARDQGFFALTGRPIEELAAGSHGGEPDEIIVTDTLASHLTDEGCLQKSASGAWLLSSLPSSSESPQSRHASRSPERAAALERKFVPRMVADRVDSTDSRWLAEFRVLSMVYVHLPSVETESDTAEWIHDAVVTIQGAIRPFGVAMFDLSVGDKGVVAQIACGLPPFAQENNAVRALEAARQIHTSLRAAGVTCSIGVSSGRAFCGNVGNSSRRECLITGPVMHVGARLMQAAKMGILCDSATARAASDHFDIHEPVSILVKGRAEPLTVYRVEDLQRTQRGIIEAGNRIYGRDEEIQQLETRFAGLKCWQRAVLVVEGEPGAGKSRLLAHVAAEARVRNFAVVGTATSSVELTTAYYACRSIVRQLLLHGSDPPGAGALLLRERLVEALRGDPLEEKAALLGDILPLDMQERGLAEQITGPARLAGIEDLFVRLASRRAAVEPLVILIDDVHWLDDPSARLLLALTRRVAGTLVAMATRPLDDTTGPNVIKLVESASIKLQLKRLAREAIVGMVCELLGVRSLPPRLGDFVYLRSEGLPFHAEQLVLALRDQGVLSISEGRCRVTISELSSSSVPNNLRDLIVSRIDALAPIHQVAAKVASAIGRTFQLEILRHLLPFTSDLSKVRDILRDLADIGILDLGIGADPSGCSFRHVIIQEATYELLTFEQRQPLHRRIAELIEQRHRDNLEAYYAELAEHYERAGEFEKAISYRQQAGLLAIRRYANHDALSHVDKVDRLCARVPIVIPGFQAAQFAQIRADAYHELSCFNEAQQHFKLCAALNGIPVPASRARVVASVIAEIGRQVLRRLGSAPKSPKATAIEKDRLAAHIFTRFAEHAYFTGDALALVHGTLTSLNRAERVGAVAEIIEGYGGLAIGLGTAGFHRIARFYRDRSVARAETEGRLHDQGFAHLLAAVYSFQAGAWEATVMHCAKGAAICQRIGDRFRYQSCRVIHAYVHILKGEYQVAEEMLRALGEDADEVENIPVRAWVLAGRAIIDMILGRSPSLALERISSARDEALHRAERLLCDGIEATAYLQAGDTASAVRAADKALANMMENAPTMGIALLSVAGVAEVHLAMAERAAAAAALSHTLVARAKAACRTISIYAAKTPICRSRALLLRGRLAMVCGRTVRARIYWGKAIAEAQSRTMPLEEALCHLWLAKGTDDPGEQRQHERAGKEILLRLGAAPWLYWSSTAATDCIAVTA